MFQAWWSQSDEEQLSIINKAFGTIIHLLVYFLHTQISDSFCLIRYWQLYFARLAYSHISALLCKTFIVSTYVTVIATFRHSTEVFHRPESKWNNICSNHTFRHLFVQAIIETLKGDLTLGRSIYAYSRNEKSCRVEIAWSYPDSPIVSDLSRSVMVFFVLIGSCGFLTFGSGLCVWKLLFFFTKLAPFKFFVCKNDGSCFG